MPSFRCKLNVLITFGNTLVTSGCIAATNELVGMLKEGVSAYLKVL
jgi:hypothetical protein